MPPLSQSDRDELTQTEDFPFTSTHVYRDNRMEDMMLDAKDLIIGPMPLKEFVNLFLPSERKEQEECLRVKFDNEISKMASCTKETDMYSHFIEAMKLVCPEFPAIDTSSTGFPSLNDVLIKPDVSYFPKDIKDHTDITSVEMMAEFKILNSDDAFTNPDYYTFESDIDRLMGQGRDTLSQIIAYATAHMTSQFRTHLFSLLVFKKHGRILFWDRSGVVVTERFLLAHEYFIEFFIRYNDATKQQRGHDVTAMSLSNAETLTARKLFPEHAKLVKLSIESKEYVAERPIWMGRSCLFGQSTRGFVAYSMLESLASDKPSPVFIKDKWRVVGRQREDLVYKRLQQKQVPFIAAALGAEDLSGQMTKVQEIAAAKNTQAISRFRGLQHFRIVLSKVASQLTSFRSTKELVSVLHDALQAHKTAYEEAGIVHGDISVKNIMIGPDRRGLLIDWDLAKNCADIQPGSEKTVILGTSQFLSARVLELVSNKKAKPIPSLVDELESFVHVLMWVALRYTPITSPGKLDYFMETIFDYLRGVGKIDYMTGGIGLNMLPRSLLRSLLSRLCWVMGVRYEASPSEMDDLAFTIQPFDSKMEDYKKRLGFLESPQLWMIETFQEFLEKTDWPVDDAAKKNPIPETEDPRERYIKKLHLEMWRDDEGSFPVS